MGTPAELERSVSGRKTVIKLQEAGETMVAALKKLSVENVVVDGNTLTIDVADPEKQNAAIVDAIVRAGGHIQSVAVVGSTLEDAYLRLVRGAT
jgi:hypothetical protein